MNIQVSVEPSSTPPSCGGGEWGLSRLPVVTKPQQVGPWAGWWGGAASWVRPRFPRLIGQPVNTQQGEGAEGRRPDGRRRGEPEARPSCRKWDLMWKHPVQQELDQRPSVITPFTVEASSAQGGAAC